MIKCQGKNVFSSHIYFSTFICLFQVLTKNILFDIIEKMNFWGVYVMSSADERFLRTKMLFGEEAMQKLASSSVIVFGIGGVGGNIAESLVRSGIGSITLVDNDTVDISNINRQIFATEDCVGMAKTKSAYKRLKNINPKCDIKLINMFYQPETADKIDFSEYDYIADAIDTVSGKLAIIENACKTGTPVISSMGTGNKTNPSMLAVSDIYKTKICPLARIMRRELKKRGIKKLKVVYSTEEAHSKISIDNGKGRPIPASCAFVPASAGLLIASEIVKDLIQNEKK